VAAMSEIDQAVIEQFNAFGCRRYLFVYLFLNLLLILIYLFIYFFIYYPFYFINIIFSSPATNWLNSQSQPHFLVGDHRLETPRHRSHSSLRQSHGQVRHPTAPLLAGITHTLDSVDTLWLLGTLCGMPPCW
jgi:hypothetical protein